MQWSDHYRRNRLHDPDREPRADNSGVLINAALAFSVCFFVASQQPRELVLASLSSLLFFAAFGATLVAALRGQSPFVPRLTGWDVAAAFVLLSYALSWFVDADAVRAALEAEAGLPSSGAG